MNGTNGSGGVIGQDMAGRRLTAREQLFEGLHVIFKRWRMIALLFCAVSLPSLVAMCFAQKPQFLAKGKVLIVSDRADLTISPTDIDTLATVKLNEAVVNSEVHIIQSRELLEQVSRGLTVASTSGGVVGVANAASNHEAIGDQVLRLTRTLKVTPIRASNVIEISYPNPDAAYAATVVNRVIDEYLGYHAMVHGQKGLSNFYDKQSRVLQTTLREAEDTLSEFSFNEGLVSPNAEIEVAVGSVSNLEASLHTITASIAGAEEKLRVIGEQLAGQPSVVKRAQYYGVNPVVEQLTEQLTSRQVDRVALLQKYTEKDRTVRDNEAEIAEIEAQLSATKRDEPTVVTQELLGSNPVYEARLTEMLKLEAQLKENRARKLAMEDELARGRRQLVVLKQKGLMFDQLEQEVKRRRSMLDLFEQRAQEANVGEAMDQEKLVNVEVVERPKLPLDRPRDRMPVALALFSALAVALGGAFGVEYINRTVRSERDIERSLGVPVLGTIPNRSRA